MTQTGTDHEGNNGGNTEEDPLTVESLAAETARGFDSRANFPKRLGRFAKWRDSALAMSEHIAGGDQRLVFKKEAHELSECRSRLLFRHYSTRDAVRLHSARTCRIHLLCPACASARGTRFIRGYIPKHEQIIGELPTLRSQMITVTVKDGPDLAERFDHLVKSLRELLKRRHRGRGSEFERVLGGVYAVEVKRGENSGLWHPHVHMFALVGQSTPVRSAILQHEWKEITGDSFIVDVRDTYGEPSDAFCEIFKYALKLGGLPAADALDAYRVMRKRHLVGAFGLFRGVEVSESMVDDLLNDESLPYVDIMWSYMERHEGSSYWSVDPLGVRQDAPVHPPVKLSPEEKADWRSNFAANDERGVA